MAQLGARFHGMEEVTGSIPVRSTNSFNKLESLYRRRRLVWVMVCAIPLPFAVVGELFNAQP